LWLGASVYTGQLIVEEVNCIDDNPALQIKTASVEEVPSRARQKHHRNTSIRCQRIVEPPSRSFGP